MKKFKEFKLNENVTDGMLRVIDFLDVKSAEISENERKNGSEYGASLTYELIDDSTLQYDFGWSDYEESDNDTVIIKLLKDGKIHISKINDGYTVMESPCDYTNAVEINLSNIDELMEWLTNEIG